MFRTQEKKTLMKIQKYIEDVFLGAFVSVPDTGVTET